MRVERLETPALIVESKVFEQNAQAMKDLLAGTSLALRPHYKSHKCAAIARWQVRNGAKANLSRVFDRFAKSVKTKVKPPEKAASTGRPRLARSITQRA